jgi:hypothetical protein
MARAAKTTAGKTATKRTVKSRAKAVVKTVDTSLADPIGTVFNAAQKRWSTEDKFRKDVTSSLTVLGICEVTNLTDLI